MPVNPWYGIKDARNFGRKCPVLKDVAKLTEWERRTTDLEDCLNMAIYSPNVRLDIFMPMLAY